MGANGGLREPADWRDFVERVDNRTLETMQAIGRLMAAVATLEERVKEAAADRHRHDIRLQVDLREMRSAIESLRRAPHREHHRRTSDPRHVRSLPSLTDIEDDDPTAVKRIKSEMAMAVEREAAATAEREAVLFQRVEELEKERQAARAVAKSDHQRVERLKLSLGLIIAVAAVIGIIVGAIRYAAAH